MAWGYHLRCRAVTLRPTKVLYLCTRTRSKHVRLGTAVDPTGEDPHWRVSVPMTQDTQTLRTCVFFWQPYRRPPSHHHHHHYDDRGPLC